ncbi:hypothetical protein [Blastococcus sp. SYSU D00820]
MSTPDPVRDLVTRAGELAAQQRIQEALTLLESCDDVRADLTYHRAWAHDRLGHDDDAVRLYCDALRRDAEAGAGRLTPDEHLGAHLGLAMVLVRRGERDHARDVVRGAERSHPGSAQVAALRLLVGDDA